MCSHWKPTQTHSTMASLEPPRKMLRTYERKRPTVKIETRDMFTESDPILTWDHSYSVKMEEADHSYCVKREPDQDMFTGHISTGGGGNNVTMPPTGLDKGTITEAGCHISTGGGGNNNVTMPPTGLDKGTITEAGYPSLLPVFKDEVWSGGWRPSLVQVKLEPPEMKEEQLDSSPPQTIALHSPPQTIALRSPPQIKEEQQDSSPSPVQLNLEPPQGLQGMSSVQQYTLEETMKFSIIENLLSETESDLSDTESDLSGGESNLSGGDTADEGNLLPMTESELSGGDTDGERTLLSDPRREDADTQTRPENSNTLPGDPRHDAGNTSQTGPENSQILPSDLHHDAGNTQTRPENRELRPGTHPRRSTRKRRENRCHAVENGHDSDHSDHRHKDLDTDEEWHPMREDSGGNCIQNASDSEEEAQPTSRATLPSVGSKNRGRGRRRGRGRGRGAQRGCGGRPVGSFPTADPPEWHEMNWQPEDIPFTADPGPLNGAAALDSDQPVDFLELFLTDELLQIIVDQTNMYAGTVSDSRIHSRVLAWKPLTVGELKTFLGLFFLTAIVHKPEVEMYWSTDEIMATPYFNKTMARNRFQIISKFLHFNDNSVSNDGTDKMYKVRPVLDYLVSKFREMYQPNTNICIDEGMLLWRGRLNFKVYNPQKPVKYGIKSYILCDSETGYCYNMKPYCGEPAALADTVVSLLGGLAGYGYRLFMDNFYNSVKLCARLLDLKTHVCGTLRKNRGEPPAIRYVSISDLGIGGRIMRHNDRVMVLAWRDKTIVRMVTTFHQNEMGQRDNISKEKPACIVEHNKSMNGVDKLDQNIMYPFVRKSNKWTNKFVAYLFEISLFNAFVIYKAKNPQGNCKCLESFIQSVSGSWTSPRHAGGEGEHNPRAPKTDPESRLSTNMAAHVLVPLLPTFKKQRPSKRCRVCSKNAQRRETRYQCKSCCVPLHKGECFILYHTKIDYAVKNKEKK